jgi:chorismate mutase
MLNAIDTLLQRMQQRLALMHDVARVKWNTKRPILDADRERVMLKDVVELGRLHHLDADRTRAFFTAQIEAAALIQEADFQRWQDERQPPFADVPDLTTLRQRIDQLNGELLAALAAARPYLGTAEGQKQLGSRSQEALGGFAVPVREAAVRPLRQP